MERSPRKATGRTQDAAGLKPESFPGPFHPDEAEYAALKRLFEELPCVKSGMMLRNGLKDDCHSNQTAVTVADQSEAFSIAQGPVINALACQGGKCNAKRYQGHCSAECPFQR